MERPSTGDFIVTFYDGYGARLKGKEQLGESHSHSIFIGEKAIEAEKDAGSLATLHSFTIDRRVYNSLDAKDKY